MYCGVIPALYGGFIHKVGSNWRIIITRPGNSPIENIAKELSKQSILPEGEKGKILYEYRLAILRSSSLGLVEVLKKIRREKDENILILVDQFEEIFRFSKSTSNLEAANESSAFIKMLSEAIQQADIPVYVVMTMRSDYIGDCAQFQVLLP